MIVRRIITYEGPEAEVRAQLEHALADGYHVRGQGVTIHLETAGGRDAGTCRPFRRRQPEDGFQ